MTKKREVPQRTRRAMKIVRTVAAAVIGIVGTVAVYPSHALDAYVGFGLGRSDARELDDRGDGFTFYGALRFNKHIALEGGPVNLGRAGAEDLERRGFALRTLGFLPLGTRAELFGAAGFYDWEAETETVKVDDGTDLTYGLGLQFHLSDRWSLRGEWARFVDVVGGDVDWVSLNAVFWFRNL